MIRVAQQVRGDRTMNVLAFYEAFGIARQVQLSLVVRDRSSSSSFAAEARSRVWNPPENRE